MDNLKKIIQATEEQSKDIISRTCALPFTELQQQAKLFLMNLNSIYQSDKSEAGLYRIHNKGQSNESRTLMRLWNLYRNKETSQALALIQQTFSLALDSYLGRQIVLTYVDNKTGQLLLYTEEGEMAILEKVGKNAGRANFTSGAWKTAEQLKTLPAELNPGTEEDLIQLVQISAAKRSEVYRTGYNRYNRVNQQGPKQDQIHTNLRKRYYIRHDNDSIYFPPDPFSLGEMAEAYANAIIQDDDDIQNSNMESSLWTLWERYIKGHKDSVAAILTGDIKIGNNGKVSLAIKGQNASTAKIGQYIVAALKITEMDNWTPEGVVQWMEQDMQSINVYAATVEAVSKQTLEDYLNEQVKQWKI